MRFYFIINPKSGVKKNKSQLLNFIKNRFEKNTFQISETERQGHAIELAKKAVAEKFDVVVAVGGDGTVNEVGQALIGTETALAIIPMGSGNGFARHFSIPLKSEKAIDLLRNFQVSKVDTGIVNNRTFLALSGLGFDAHISHEFANYSKRGFWSYFKITLRELFSYKSEHYEISLNGERVKEQAFLITVANTSQFGNNATIAPMAKANDGQLNVCVLRRMNLFQAFSVSIALFSKKLEGHKSLRYFKASEVEIKVNKVSAYHLDGEPLKTNENLRFKIVPNSLNLVVPHDN